MSFIMAGVPALIGAALMLSIRCLRDERVEACDKQTEDQLHILLNKPAWTAGTFYNGIQLTKFMQIIMFFFSNLRFFINNSRYFDGY